jgi:chemotaxis receptor (MCP) glutamine deamidase CheD
MKKDQFELKPYSKLLAAGQICVDWDEAKKSDKGTIWTFGVGPCLVVTLHNPKTNEGLLAHLTGCPNVKEGFCREEATTTLLKYFPPQSYVQLNATLSGESIIYDNPFFSSIVRKELEKNHITIVGEDLGPSVDTRAVVLDCDSGKVEVFRV